MEFSARRGFYAAFDFRFDLVTMLGLQTDGNLETVLASMPPSASWLQ